jgi:hypothetical protein
MHTPTDTHALFEVGAPPAACRLGPLALLIGDAEGVLGGRLHLSTVPASQRGLVSDFNIPHARTLRFGLRTKQAAALFGGGGCRSLHRALSRIRRWLDAVRCAWQMNESPQADLGTPLTEAPPLQPPPPQPQLNWLGGPSAS